MAQHSKPQIKRSVGFLKKLMHKLEDARDLVYKFSDVEAVTADTADEASAVFGELGDLLSSVETFLDHEMAMNWSVFIQL